MVSAHLSKIRFLVGAMLGAAAFAAPPLPSTEMESVVLDGRITVVPGRNEADATRADGLIVDAGKSLPALGPAPQVRYVSLTRFTGWNDGLRTLLGSLPKLNFLVIKGEVAAIGDDWRFLCALPELRYLRLELAQLDAVPLWFREFKQLRGLDLSRNRLRQVPPVIFALSALEELDLSENAIDRIEDSFVGLTALRRLNLSHNNIQAILRSAGPPPQLTTLELKHNKLEAAPVSFISGSSLEELALEYNYFSTLPEAWWETTRVKRLSLSNYAGNGDAIAKRRPDIDLTLFRKENALPPE